jgi:hypothetical protein
MASQLFQEDPEKALALLKYAAHFSDFPKDFVSPAILNPNYFPPNKSRSLEILCYVLAAVTTILVISRLWLRARVAGKKLGWDDWLIIPGQVSRTAIP